MKDTTESWKTFVTPDILRSKLISASIYLAAFEILKESIVEHLENFFSNGFDTTGPLASPKYATEVLSRNKSPVYASLSWLKEQGAIDDVDIAAYENIKKCRNQVAHELPKIIAGNNYVDFLEQFPIMVSLLKKIEVWWIVNVEIPTHPDFADAEVDEDGIIPGPVWTLQIMLDVALGDPEKASYYLEQFKKFDLAP